MNVLDTPTQINRFRMHALKGALTMEVAGMTRRGASVYSIVKKEFGLKGSKQKVLDQLTQLLEGGE